MAHPYQADLEIVPDRTTAFRTRCSRRESTAWTERKHQLEAVDRWFTHGWSKLDARLRSSITEGIVVFLSLFDDNPAVHRAFCPPRSAYAGDADTGRPEAAAAARQTCSRAGTVLALNFPVGLNPGLARAWA